MALLQNLLFDGAVVLAAYLVGWLNRGFVWPMIVGSGTLTVTTLVHDVAAARRAARQRLT